MTIEQARAARDTAIELVEAFAKEQWLQEAQAALLLTIQTHLEFTTDDIDCSTPREPRAWGPVVLRAARAGLIENTYRTRQSSSAVCHARPKTIWRVLTRKEST